MKRILQENMHLGLYVGLSILFETPYIYNIYILQGNKISNNLEYENREGYVDCVDDQRINEVLNLFIFNALINLIMFSQGKGVGK